MLHPINIINNHFWQILESENKPAWVDCPNPTFSFLTWGHALSVRRYHLIYVYVYVYVWIGLKLRNILYTKTEIKVLFLVIAAELTSQKSAIYETSNTKAERSHREGIICLKTYHRSRWNNCLVVRSSLNWAVVEHFKCHCSHLPLMETRLDDHIFDKPDF